MEETNLCVLYNWYQNHSLCLFNTHKTFVFSFLCAQKQAKKQNQRNLRKGRLCPWCWPNMQLTTHSITVSSATSIWTSIPPRRLVSRCKGKLHPWFFWWFLQEFLSGLRTQAFTFPEMELILPFSGEILSYRCWSISRVCCILCEQSSLQLPLTKGEYCDYLPQAKVSLNLARGFAASHGR